MASLRVQILLFLSIYNSLVTSSGSPVQTARQYIVYMGSSSNENGEDDETAESSHLQMLSSIIPSEEKERISLIHHYSHAFKGFSAMLTPDEASLLSRDEGVVSVFRNPILELHTTRSWNFLEAESGLRLSHSRHPVVTSDVIIGIIDTGIWPESPSFNDEGMGKIPSRWKGICMEAPDFKKSNCNRKLIGARYYGTTKSISAKKNNTTYVPDGSPRDNMGHGTHTSSIAAGAVVAHASYYGLARGTVRGGLTSSRIAAYKACTPNGCSGATLLKAIEDAIKDGVDIISISIGLTSMFQPDYLNDPIAIGAFHAKQNGIIVVCSAGNGGPNPYTITNSAPWIFTVAASNIDRDFQSSLVLGNGSTFQGSAINFSNLTRTRKYPLVFAGDVAANFTPLSEARSCIPGSLDRAKVRGKLIVCVDDGLSVSRQIKKLVVEDAGAEGMILVSEIQKGVPFDSGVFPFTQVGSAVGFQLLHYINSTKKPTATILPSVNIPRYRPAPTVAYFSARGPAEVTENILKPDIMAPGVAILAAVVPKNETGTVPSGKKPSEYAIRSGTSMACPHVAGAIAFIKSVHPKWSTSMIKSALMTTATTYNNMRKPLTNSSGYLANPHEMGVGEINPIRALNPGLVFETTTHDYLLLLCHHGYSNKHIRSMSKTNFTCPKTSFEELISNINYPSISIGKLDRHHGVRTVQRTVINVGLPNVTYVARARAPEGLIVKVWPVKIVFKEGLKRMSFNVSFYGKKANSGYNFGSVTFSGGKHSVRLVFAVNVE